MQTITHFPEQDPIIQKHRARIGITNTTGFGKRVSVYTTSARKKHELMVSTWQWNKGTRALIYQALGENKEDSYAV